MNTFARLCAALAAALALVTLVSAQQTFAQSTFSNPAPVNIVDGSGGTPGGPYPSTINVSGLQGNAAKVTVQLNGFTHGFPADVDLLLVGPNGQGVILMSDAGGPTDVAEMNVAFDDDAAQNVPIEGPVETATYKPTDYDDFGADEYPPPAPSGPHATTLSAFNGINPNGTWSLYVVDDQFADEGRISGGWSLSISVPPTPVNAGDAVISEFRLRGPSGADDEYVEISNRTANYIVVGSADGSSGWALVASDGATRFVVPNGTIIPPGGHFLGVNGGGYSLDGYAAGVNRYATGDATYANEIPDGAGLALFESSNPANFTSESRLDAVGFAGVTNTLYREGAGLTPAAGVTENVEQTFARRLNVAGPPTDTDDNEANFWFLSTTAATLSGRASSLGAPGPENLSSPTQRYSGLPVTQADPAVTASAAPNRVRDLTPGTLTPNGHLSFRKLATNNTGAPVTRLRFRVFDITTKGYGGGVGGVADVRMLSAPTIKITLSDGRTVRARGMALEQLPAQSVEGGGLNSTVTLALDKPLQPGESVYVHYVTGTVVSGSFRLNFTVEALN